MYRVKFAFQNRLGQLLVRRKFTIFALFYIRRGDLTEGFLRYDFEGLIFGGAYFRNFTVLAFCSLCFLAPLRRCFCTMSTYSAKAPYGRFYNSDPCLSCPFWYPVLRRIDSKTQTWMLLQTMLSMHYQSYYTLAVFTLETDYSWIIRVRKIIRLNLKMEWF